MLEFVRQLLTEYLVARLISSPALAYLVSLAIDHWSSGEAKFVELPTYFWLVFSALVFCITLYPAWIAPVIKRYKLKRTTYFENVNNAYKYVLGAYNVHQLQFPDYDYKTKAWYYAEESVDLLRPKLIRKYRGTGKKVPDEIDVEDEYSLDEWLNFLRKERELTVSR